MWGSWVGAVWGILSIFTFGGEIENMIQAGGWRWIPYFPSMFVYKLLNIGGIQIGGISLLPILIIFGFLIGWGIHSLIRKLRR